MKEVLMLFMTVLLGFSLYSLKEVKKTYTYKKTEQRAISSTDKH